MVRGTLCTTDIKLLYVSLRPVCLPRMFACVCRQTDRSFAFIDIVPLRFCPNAIPNLGSIINSYVSSYQSVSVSSFVAILQAVILLNQ